jgi:hypothetical protein
MLHSVLIVWIIVLEHCRTITLGTVRIDANKLYKYYKEFSQNLHCFIHNIIVLHEYNNKYSHGKHPNNGVTL